MSSDLIIVLDVGSTNLKCHLFTNRLQLLCEKRTEIKIISSSDGLAEINPDVLWTSIVSIVNDCLKEKSVDIKQVACFGFSCHRGSFITWDRNTGVPYHNFISWKDLRARKDVQRLNNNLMFRIFKWFAYLVYLVSRSPRFLTASLFKFTNAQVTCRLLWALKHYAPLKRAARNGHAMFGTLDTWLLYRLTAGKTYCTDISMASSTGLFDPYTSAWIKLVKFVGLGIALPNITETAGHHFGEICPDIWGAALPITCSMADQAAALYGSRCFQPGELKITLGTGAFLDVNVGCKAVASKAGLYPLVGWKYEGQLAYTLEATCHDCGTVIDWLIESKDVGIRDQYPCNSEKMEFVFIECMSRRRRSELEFPTPSTEMPIDDATAGTGFIGINTETKKEDLIMAVLEAVIFRAYEIYKLYEAEANSTSYHPIKVNGGVSNNDYICQSLADICCKTVRRPSNVETSILGVASLACKVLGTSTSDLYPGVNEDQAFQIFLPNEVDGYSLRRKYKKWQRAVEKFLHWRE